MMNYSKGKTDRNMKKALINFVSFGSIFYTLITTGLLLVASALAEENAVKLIEIDQFLKVLLFSFMLSLGSTLIRVDSIPRTAAFCAHAGCYIVGWIVFVALCGANFAVTVISAAVFAIIYALATFIIRLIGKKKRANDPANKAPVIIKTKKNDKNSYTSQFH